MAPIRGLGASIYFYPRPPRGGRRCPQRASPPQPCISIHALREEGDAVVRLSIPCDVLFLSTPSARRATTASCWRSLPRPISIHALREEGDRAGIPPSMRVSEFLSTPSARRATRLRPGWFQPIRYFYPRPPRGGRRRITRFPGFYFFISIHALREEGDDMSLAIYDEVEKFLSTPSARRATRRQG